MYEEFHMVFRKSAFALAGMLLVSLSAHANQTRGMLQDAANALVPLAGKAENAINQGVSLAGKEIAAAQQSSWFATLKNAYAYTVSNAKSTAKDSALFTAKVAGSLVALLVLGNLVVGANNAWENYKISKAAFEKAQRQQDPDKAYKDIIAEARRNAELAPQQSWYMRVLTGNFLIPRNLK